MSISSKKENLDNDPPDPFGTIACVEECIEFDCAGDNGFIVTDGINCTEFCAGLGAACDVQ
ncbi:hypothetical protein [Sulfuracidifex metallicus]|uniref:Uncharacterized protein n=1 Tax=Sulfuracidifex metallicus DSM 6482 = JCM 9184 TaxID=523847 RepID=A0A6A9QQH0_SULME|nr:hypothetical protein [Sulfuracidifex metallicus]MUN30008.1 hypothetical protein [Sulfuracidifex metallicus DSM 6482 = JCM 9184]WOE51610.1 hypothetical protein RQ359_000928 [Sulfuracidifex metallicus DSM 6482 = JCM 9184]